MEVVIRNGQLYSVDGRRILGKCTRCGACCEAQRCPHLKFELWNGNTKVAMCNPETLRGGYFGRYMTCVAYPTPDDILPGCGYRYE